MKKPKKMRRFCKYCNKHTEQTLSIVSTGHKRGSLKRGGIPRARKRGLARGTGSKGKWGSKPAITKWKRKTKSHRKTNVMYTCKTCNKSTVQRKGVRAGKFQLAEK